MNAMLMRNDFQLAQTVIENVSDDLINEWNRNIGKVDDFTQVTGLMATLYTWAIKGLINHNNYAKPKFSFSISLQSQSS